MRGGEREHGGEHAVRLQLQVGEGGEIGRQPRLPIDHLVALAPKPAADGAQALDAAFPRPLVDARDGEQLAVAARARVGRVLDDEILAAVRHRDRGGLTAVGGGVETGPAQHVGQLLPHEQLERAGLALDHAHGGDVAARVFRGDAGGRQPRGGHVRGEGVDVDAREAFLHERLVQVVHAPARRLVAVADVPVGGAQERARAAGEVGDAQPAQRVRAGPVVHGQPVHGQPGQQFGGDGQRVVRRRFLAVGQQFGEEFAREIDAVAEPRRRDLASQFAEGGEGVAGLRVRNARMQGGERRAEDGPVVHREDLPPLGADGVPVHAPAERGVPHARHGAQPRLRQRGRLLRQAVLQAQGRQPDAAGQPQALIEVFLPQAVDDGFDGSRAGAAAQVGGDAGDAHAHLPRHAGDEAGRRGGVFAEAGEVVHVAGDEAARGPAQDVAFEQGLSRRFVAADVGVQHHEPEGDVFGRGELPLQPRARPAARLLGQADGDGGADGVGRADDALAQPPAGVGEGGIAPLRLHGHGVGVGRLHEDVDLLVRVLHEAQALAGDGFGVVLPVAPPPPQLFREDFVEGVLAHPTASGGDAGQGVLFVRLAHAASLPHARRPLPAFTSTMAANSPFRRKPMSGSEPSAGRRARAGTACPLLPRADAPPAADALRERHGARMLRRGSEPLQPSRFQSRNAHEN